MEPDDFGFQFGDGRSLGRISDEVLLLGRIFDEVEEFPGVRFPIVDEFVGRRADAVVGASVVVAGVVVVAVVNRVAPAGGFFAAQNRGEGAAVHVGGDFHAGEIEEGGGEVGVEGEEVGDGAGLDAGAAREERDVEPGLIHEAFVVEAEVAEIPTVVGAVDHDGVFRESGAVEVVEDFADAVVDALHAGEVVLHVALVFPADEFFAGEKFFGAVGLRDFELHRFGVEPLLAGGPGGEVGGWLEFQVPAGEIAGDGLLVSRERGGSGRVVVPEGGGLGDDFVFEEGFVFGVGLPGAVRSFLVQHQEERFIGGARIDKLEAELGGDLADVSLQGDATVWRDEIGIEVNALAGENHPAVEAGGVAAEVPFADHPGVVAGGLEHFRDGGLGTVEDVEDGGAVGVGVFSGEHDGAARSANGVGDEGVVEADAGGAEAVQMGRPVHL